MTEEKPQAPALSGEVPLRTYWVMDTHLQQVVGRTVQQMHLAMSVGRSDESKVSIAGKATKLIAIDEHLQLLASARASDELFWQYVEGKLMRENHERGEWAVSRLRLFREAWAKAARGGGA